MNPQNIPVLTCCPPAVRPDNEDRRTAVFKNPHLRLLMRLVGMERLAPTLDETPDSGWVVAPGITAGALAESVDLINKAEFNPPTFDSDESAADQLRRKTAPRKRAAYDDDDDGGGANDGDDDDDDMLFPMGGPTARKVIDDDEQPRKKLQRRRRRKGSEEEEGAEADEEKERQREERALKRRDKEREKARRVKSEMYVRASDDETDDERDREFFEREKAKYDRLQRDLSSHLNALLADSGDEEEGAGGGGGGGGSRKRKSGALVVVDDDDDDDDDSADGEDARPSPSARGNKRARTKKGGTLPARVTGDGETDSEAESARPSRGLASGDEMETDDTPLSSSPRVDVPAAAEDDDDDEALPVRAKPMVRARARGGFLVDSSDEDD